jgi:hypothetical protein
MGEKLSTEDLTGRRSDTREDDRMQVGSDRPMRNDPADERAADDASLAPREASGTPEARAADDASIAPQGATEGREAANEPLLAGDDGTRFERRWHQVQIAFVDEPRAAVEQADQLVAELMRHLAETFADERSRLETAWSAGEDVDTEALRVALTRYRSFFQRLLAT